MKVGRSSKPEGTTKNLAELLTREEFILVLHSVCTQRYTESYELQKGRGKRRSRTTHKGHREKATHTLQHMEKREI